MTQKSWFQAAIDDDATVTKQNLQRFVKSRNEHGLTALMLAALHGSINVAKLLNLEQNMQSPSGQTALMLAAASSQKIVAELLVDEADQFSPNNVNALMMAASCGSLSVVNILNRILLHKVTTAGTTALMLAAAQGHSLCCRALMEEIDSTDQRGRTALMYAAESGQPDTVKLLLQQTRLTDTNGDSALMLCLKQVIQHQTNAFAAHRLLECVKLLIPSEHDIVAADQVTVVMKMASAGLVPPQNLIQNQQRRQNSRGETALMLAASVGCDAAVQVLIQEAGMRNSAGETAAIIAARAGYLQCLQTLMPFEAEIQSYTGDTVMHAAAGGESTAVLKYLMEKYQSNVANSDKEPPLFAAIAAQKATNAAVLIGQICVVSASGKTALMQAAQYDFAEFIEEHLILLKKQADKKTKQNETASMMAGRCDSVRVLSLLLEMERQTADSSPLFEAAQHNGVRVAKAVADWARGAVPPHAGAQPGLQKVCQNLLELRTKNIRDVENGLNALELAVVCGSNEVAVVLAPVRMKQNLELTPLMTAVMREGIQAKTVRALFKTYGGQQLGKKSSQFGKGCTALMIAVVQQFDNADIVRELAAERALKDGAGQTAEDYARAAGREYQ